MNLANRKGAKQKHTRQRRPVSCCFMPICISPQRLANAESVTRCPYSTAFGSEPAQVRSYAKSVSTRRPRYPPV